MMESITVHEEVVNLLGARVLVEPDEYEDKTAGGIYKPDTTRQRVQRGVVVNVGPDCQHVHPGDYVIYPRWATSDVLLNGKTLYLFREEDIHGILGNLCSSKKIT